MQFKHWPRAGPLKAPPLCCGWISVTLAKHFGHLWGMKIAMKQMVYWLRKACNLTKAFTINSFPTLSQWTPLKSSISLSIYLAPSCLLGL